MSYNIYDEDMMVQILYPPTPEFLLISLQKPYTFRSMKFKGCSYSVNVYMSVFVCLLKPHPHAICSGWPSVLSQLCTNLLVYPSFVTQSTPPDTSQSCRS